MRPRVKASVLWGLVGALAFLVLAQGYRLVVGRLVGFAALLVVAGVVGVAAAALAYAAQGRLARKERV
jgi:hypothetical protein